MKHWILLLVLLTSLLPNMFSQSDSSSINKTFYNGDSIYVVNSEPVFINGTPKKAGKKMDYDRYNRLIINLRKVYPYAKLTRKKLEEINTGLTKIKTDKERKEYIKSRESELFGQYEDELSSLTVSQGKLLMKLVYRETQHSTFDLIKEYKGNISAVFWQSIARIFGSNLKVTYDPFGEDQIIEELIILYEQGQL